jgi:hypothetical protein
VRCRLAVIAGIATLTVACSACEDQGDRPATDGPLVAQVGSGGNSLDAPRGRARWTGTFGSLLVCVEDGDSVEIESVSYHVVVRPIAIRPLIRQVPELSERRGGPAERWRPMIALRGTVRQLEDDEIGASSLEPPHGAVVSTSCDEDPDGPYTELITSMTTDRRGGWVDKATIAYTSGGREYELDIHWTYIACGTAINELWTDDTMPAPCGRPRS